MEVMLDIETMGNGSNSPIVSIGAVKFDRLGVYDEFYEVISLEDAVKSGGEIDPSTVIWWLKQSKDAINSTFFPEKEPVTTRDAINKLRRFIGGDVNGVWGNGVAFDNVIISNTAKRLGLEPVWPFWLDRCYRTMKGLNKDIPVSEYGTAHNALDDAIKQAHHLNEILSKQNKGE